MLEKLSTDIQTELTKFNLDLQNNIKTTANDYRDVIDYILQTRGKQIRPIVGILVAKMLGKFTEKQSRLLQAVELIHNATLFHDDVIDEAETRRNMPALHTKFSNKIAILSGDYFLSVAIKTVYSLKNDEVNRLVADYMKKICEGEIEQNLTLNKIISMKEYLKKTQYKTALLFRLASGGVALLSEKSEYQNAIESFGENLGMLFQIHDDIKNFQNYEDKPVLNDLKSGVITAPIIFLAESNNQISSLLEKRNYDKIMELLSDSDALKKAYNLAEDYLQKAEKALNTLPDNKYRKSLVELLSDFRKYGNSK